MENIWGISTFVVLPILINSIFCATYCLPQCSIPNMAKNERGTIYGIPMVDRLSLQRSKPSIKYLMPVDGVRTQDPTCHQNKTVPIGMFPLGGFKLAFVPLCTYLSQHTLPGYAKLWIVNPAKNCCD